MNDPTVLTTDGQFTSDREPITETQQEFGGTRETLLGHIVLTLLFLVAVLLRTIL